MDNKINRKLVINVKFKVRDVLRYNMDTALKSNLNKVMLGVGILFLGIYIYRLFYRTEPIDLFIVRYMPMLLVPILVFLFIPWRVWKITLSQMQMPAFAFGVTYTFLSDKIILDLGDSKDEMPWHLFIKILETKNDFRFYVDTVRAQLLPKHNLTSEQLVLFREIAVEATHPNVCLFKHN